MAQMRSFFATASVAALLVAGGSAFVIPSQVSAHARFGLTVCVCS